LKNGGGLKKHTKFISTTTLSRLYFIIITVLKYYHLVVY